MKIMIIRPGALGDTIVCIPFLKVLSKNHDITFVGREPGIYFVKKVIQNVHNIEIGWWHNIFRDNFQLNKDLSGHYDIVVGFFRVDREIIEKNLLQVFKNAKVFLYPSFPEQNKGIHIFKYIFQIFEKLGLKIRASDLKMVIREGIFSRLPLKDAYIVYHIGSGSTKKNFNVKFWINIKQIVAKYFPDRSHIFLFGPAEEDLFYECFDTLKNEGIQPLFLNKAQALENVLCDASLYLGHDSGPTHLSALIGIPTIALFKASSMKVWRPVGRYVKVLKAGVEGNMLGLIEQVIKRVWHSNLCCQCKSTKG